MLILFVNDNTRLSDDVVFVCEVSWENVYVLKVLLRGGPTKDNQPDSLTKISYQ